MEFGGISKGGGLCIGNQGGGLSRGRGSPRCSEPVVVLFCLSAGVSLFSIFLACDLLILLVIDCLGIGFVLFVDTIILDVLVLV